jgi:hypothetical protein
MARRVELEAFFGIGRDSQQPADVAAAAMPESELQPHP